MTRRALLPLAALALVALVGCSSDDDGESSETTAAGEDLAEVCVPLRVISDYDTQSAEIITTAQDYDVLKDFLVESGPGISAAYDEVASLEPDLAEDALLLRDITNATVEAAAGASSLPELSTVLLANPDAANAGAAALRINAFAEKECGFSTGNN